MATLQKTVGLRWLLLGVFPYGVKLRRVEGSHAVWVRSDVEPVEWSDGNRVISSITPEARIRITPQHLFMLYHVEICRHVN